jgi:hypothetical protein
LDGVLDHLGGALDDGPTELYRALLDRLGQDKGFWKRPNLPHAFLAVALGADPEARSADRLGSLEGEAFAIARHTAQRGGRRVLAAVDARTADWPQTAKTQWNFLRRAVAPTGAGRLVRDAACFVSGAFVVLAVAKVMQLLG